MNARFRSFGAGSAAALCVAACIGAAASLAAKGEVRLITLDPAHFHAALVQKEMLPGVAKRVAVYAPLGPDILEHLGRIAQFNARSTKPTNWEMDVHCTPRSLEEMLRDRPGNVVVISGRNRGKIDKINASLNAGINVLADKPLIIRRQDLPALESALETAARNGLVVRDLMTERYEITTILQRALVGDRAVFGSALAGSAEDPGVFIESVHHIMKAVAGVPNRRPFFFFDIQEQGEGMADVGTHLVDMAHWTLFPNHSVDYREDIRVLDGRRWPTILTESQLRAVTGAAEFPPAIRAAIGGGGFPYYCNNRVRYTVKGIHVTLEARWDYESPAEIDTHHAVYRGTNARIEVRQGAEEKHRPELYVVPAAPELRGAVGEALRRRIAAVQAAYPGVGVRDSGAEFLVTIPDRYRVGHEPHFAELLNQFLEYVKSPRSIPAWERPNMIAKYYVTTMGVELSHAGAVSSAGRPGRGVEK